MSSLLVPQSDPAGTQQVSEVTSVVNDRLRDAEHRRKVVAISEELNNAVPVMRQSVHLPISHSHAGFDSTISKILC